MTKSSKEASRTTAKGNKKNQGKGAMSKDNQQQKRSREQHRKTAGTNATSRSTQITEYLAKTDTDSPDKKKAKPAVTQDSSDDDEDLEKLKAGYKQAEGVRNTVTARLNSIHIDEDPDKIEGMDEDDDSKATAKPATTVEQELVSNEDEDNRTDQDKDEGSDEDDDSKATAKPATTVEQDLVSNEDGDNGTDQDKDEGSDKDDDSKVTAKPATTAEQDQAANEEGQDVSLENPTETPTATTESLTDKETGEKPPVTEKSSKKKHRNKKKNKKPKARQTFVCQVGKDGKIELASKEDEILAKKINDRHPILNPILDEAYYKEFAQERARPNNFRCNFTLNLESHEIGEETRLQTALRMFKEIAQIIGIIDPSTVFQPWIPGLTMISPPIKATEIDDDTNMKKFCKNIYNNARNKDKAKIEINVGTDLMTADWLNEVGNYLQGEHHSRAYLNFTTGPNSINIGYGVMSTPWVNAQAMGRRLSQDSGINIGCKIGDIVLESEQGTYYGPDYTEKGVQAVMFYADRNDKDEATEYLSNLLTGGYTTKQLMTCPLMKFCLKPGGLTGAKYEKYHATMKKKQCYFMQNIMMSSIGGHSIMSRLDEKVKFKEGVTSNKKEYTIRQMIMLLRNPMPATKADFPYLYYDVDRLGSSTDLRFVYFGFLEDKAEEAADSLLAMLERQFSRDYDIGAHFSLTARADAAKYPWTSKKGGHAQGKPPRSKVDIPKLIMLTCQNDEEDSVNSEDDSIKSKDDSSKEEEPTRFHIPNQDTYQPAGAIRTSDAFKGLHAQSSASLHSKHTADNAIQLYEEPKENDQDEDAATWAAMVDDQSLGNTTIQTTNTMVPKIIERFGDDEMYDKMLEAEDQYDDNLTMVLQEEPEGQPGDVSSGLNEEMNEKVIEEDDQDEDNRTIAPLPGVAAQSGDDSNGLNQDEISVMTSNTLGTIEPLVNAPQITNDETTADNSTNSTRTHHPILNNTPRADSKRASTVEVDG